MLLIAALVATDKGMLGGHGLGAGRVLYLAGENPDDIRMRWIAMSEHLGFDPDDIEVHFIDGRPSLIENVESITREVEELGGVVLIIIDTAAAYFEGTDENSNVESGEYARRLRELTKLKGGPCVVVNCHPTKNAGEEGLVPRGGGAFLFEVDGNLTSVNQ
jgi:RecA-family ATPase